MTLSIRNRQRVRRVNVPLVRRITRTLLTDLLGVESYELGIHLVAAPEMARLNETFLHHKGSTDVITFDHSLGVPPSGGSNAASRLKPELQTLNGELFICIDDAIKQARQFRTTWQSELVRYLIHGILHLLGHDDLKPAARRKMKREENRLLGEITHCFPIADLAKPSSRLVNRKSKIANQK